MADEGKHPRVSLGAFASEGTEEVIAARAIGDKGQIAYSSRCQHPLVGGRKIEVGSPVVNNDGILSPGFSKELGALIGNPVAARPDSGADERAHVARLGAESTCHPLQGD